MKKVKIILSLLVLATACLLLISPHAFAENYISLHDNNDIWLKYGSTSVPWVTIANVPSGVNYVNTSGNIIAYSDNNNELWVKEGLNGTWVLEATGERYAAVDSNTIAYIDNNGDLWAKQGGLYGAWSLLETNAETVNLSANRMAVTYDFNGSSVLLETKQLPLNSPWIFEANIAAPENGSNGVSWPEIQVTDNDLGFISGDYTQFFIKQGSLFNAWTTNYSNPNYTFYFLMTDNRLCVNIDPSSDAEVYCKDGSDFNSGWTLISDNAYLDSITDNEIGIQSLESYNPTDGLYIFKGPVSGGYWTPMLDQGDELIFNP